MGLNTLSWKKHTDQLIDRLSQPCYVIRQIKPYMSQTVLITIYYAPFHSIMSNSIIVCRNSTHSSKIFKIIKELSELSWEKWVDSCRNLYQEFKISPFQSQYILSLLLFLTSNKDNLLKIWSSTVYILDTIKICIYLEVT